MAYDVFISYARKDRQTANFAAASFADQGLSVWHDTQIEGGADWRDTIVKNLEQSRCLVILFSKAANASRQVRKEIAVAKRLDIPIIPVKIDSSQPRGPLLLALTDRDWIDLAADPIGQMDTFAATLLNALNEAAQTADDTPVAVSRTGFQPKLGLFPFNRGDADWLIGVTLFFFILSFRLPEGPLVTALTPIFGHVIFRAYPVILVRIIYRFAKANRSYLSALPTYLLLGVAVSALHFVTYGSYPTTSLENLTAEEHRQIITRALFTATLGLSFLLHIFLRGLLAAQAIRRRARA